MQLNYKYNFFYIFGSIAITNYSLKVIQLHFNYFSITIQTVCILKTRVKLLDLTDNSWPRNMSNKNIKTKHSSLKLLLHS